MNSKLAWVLLALAIAFALLWLGPVDFAAGQSLRDIVRESEGGQMPSQEEFNRRRHSTDDTQIVPDGRSSSEGRPDGQDSWSAPAVESSPTMKKGESHSPSDEHSEHGPDSTPPGGLDGGAAGRLLAPPMIYAFFGWATDGRFLGGRNFETAEDCDREREQDRARYPSVQFSLCAMLWAERERL